MLQLTQEHHLSFDFLLWPQIRDNLIKHGARYELEGVMGLMCATLRLRGSFGAHFITRSNGEEPRVKEDFYQQILDTSRYGILQRFWEVVSICLHAIVASTNKLQSSPYPSSSFVNMSICSSSADTASCAFVLLAVFLTDHCRSIHILLKVSIPL